MTAQADDRRAQILAATCQVIGREGVASVSTRTIAREARVNLGTLHTLFGSKDALLLALLEQVTGEMIDLLTSPAQAHQGLVGALTEIGAAHSALAKRDPRLPLARCELLLYLSRRGAHVRDALAQHRRYVLALATTLRRARGEAEHGVDCGMLARLLASSMDGLALHATVTDVKSYRQNRAQALRALRALVDEGAGARQNECDLS